MELTLAMGLIGLLAVWVTPLVLNGTRTFLYLPNVSTVHQAGHDLLNAVIEGSRTGSVDFIPGLRFAKQLQEARPTQVAFLVYAPTQATVTVRWNGTLNRCERRVDGGPFEPLPYYAAAGLSVVPAGGAIFRYYEVSAGGSASEVLPLCVDADGPLLCPADRSRVDRIHVRLQVHTGTGELDMGHAKLVTASAATLRIP